MKSKSIVLAVVLIIIFTLTLAACSNDAPPSGTATPTPSQSAEGTVSPDPSLSPSSSLSPASASPTTDPSSTDESTPTKQPPTSGEPTATAEPNPTADPPVSTEPASDPTIADDPTPTAEPTPTIEPSTSPTASPTATPPTTQLNPLTLTTYKWELTISHVIKESTALLRLWGNPNRDVPRYWVPSDAFLTFTYTDEYMQSDQYLRDLTDGWEIEGLVTIDVTNNRGGGGVGRFEPGVATSVDIFSFSVYQPEPDEDLDDFYINFDYLVYITIV